MVCLVYSLTMHHVVIARFCKQIPLQQSIYIRSVTQAPMGASMREIGVVYSALILL